jgi:hypothetical protein
MKLFAVSGGKPPFLTCSILVSSIFGEFWNAGSILRTLHSKGDHHHPKDVAQPE